MRGVVIILVPSLPRFLGRIFRLVSSRMVPSRSMRGSAYQHVCKWDASTAGNGDGTSYVLVDGVSVVQWHA